ncbi:MAG: di-heme-cytochrome C peroxidase [Nitrospirae bacterium]|nr:di-heme-cytochrome C peroxidase [Nitrospirota bacterium]
MKRQILFILASSLLLMVAGSMGALGQEEPKKFTLQGQGIPEHELPGPSIQKLGTGAKVLKLKLWKAVTDKVGEAIDTEKLDDDLKKHIVTNEDDFKKNLKDLMKLQLAIMTAKMTSPVRRGQHLKDHACVAAEFTVEGGIPDDLKQGVFQTPKTYKAVIRFSNARSLNDTATNVQGMAIKLFGVGGEKLLKDEMDADTQDFLLADDQAFFAKNPFEMKLLMTARVEQAKGNEMPFNHPGIPTPIQDGLQKLTEESIDPLAKSKLKPPKDPPHGMSFWSQTPYRLRGSEAKFVKYFTKPTSPGAGPDTFKEHWRRDNLLARLSEGSVEFEFFVQPFVESFKELLNDPTKPWDPITSPFVKVATITIHKQDFNSLNHRKHCENLSFTPWHSLSVHEPYGEINLARKYVYLGSSLFRHAANGAPRYESTGKELLAFKAKDTAGAWLPESPQYPRTLHECIPTRESEPYKGKKVTWLKQGFNNKMRRDFYHLSQGTEIIPYKWFLHLEQVFSEDLFRAEENLCRYKIIPDPKYDKINPDGLPVGFTKTVDEDHPVIKEWLGFNCAACHTGQLEFAKTRIIIDGGQAMWDARKFAKDMFKALAVTLKDEKKFTRFADKVREKDFMVVEFKKEDSEDQASYERRIELMKLMGKGQLAKELMAEFKNLMKPLRKEKEKRKLQLRKTLQANVLAFLGEKVFAQKRDKENAVFPTEWGFGRNDALGRGGNSVLTPFHPGNLRVANAPMSFPKLWDAWRYKWVQWNASITQPIGRNIGEAIGVGARLTPGLFNLKTGLLGTDPVLCWKTYNWATGEGKIDSAGTYNWVDGKEEIDLTNPTKPCIVGINTSVNLENLVLLENWVRELTVPEWPGHLFGPINVELRDKGEKLYMGKGELGTELDRNKQIKCIRCHYKYKVKKKDSPPPLEYELREIAIGNVGTDATAAHNFYARRVDVPMLGWKNKTAAEATQDLTNVVLDTLCRERESYCKDHKEDLTRGRENIYRAPLVYMAGTNVGVWATAPYLHNGSVPNLYQLLSPGKERSVKFCLGNLEFDPKRVGFVTSKPPCAPFDEFEFDTGKTGNSNSGHEFRELSYGEERTGSGVIGPELTPDERLAIIEYLKTLNYPPKE